MRGFTGDRRTNNHFVHAQLVEFFHPGFINQGAALYQQRFAIGGKYVFGNDSAQHAISKSLDDIAAFNNRCGEQASLGTTIFIGDHNVLSHVHKTPC